MDQIFEVHMTWLSQMGHQWPNHGLSINDKKPHETCIIAILFCAFTIFTIQKIYWYYNLSFLQIVSQRRIRINTH